MIVLMYEYTFFRGSTIHQVRPMWQYVSGIKSLSETQLLELASCRLVQRGSFPGPLGSQEQGETTTTQDSPPPPSISHLRGKGGRIVCKTHMYVIHARETEL